MSQGKLKLHNLKNPQTKYSLYLPHSIKLARFDNIGTQLAVCDDTTIYLSKQHYKYTMEELILKNALYNWLLIEKPNKNLLIEQPNKKVSTLEKILKDVALKSGLLYTELQKGWLFLPGNLQAALLKNITTKIQKYGKYGSSLVEAMTGYMSTFSPLK
jgi:hypothetical protein